MHCPFCSASDSKVIDSRLVADGYQVRRRRECNVCHERFTTFETAELVMPKVVKKDGAREPFDDEKLRNGVLRSVEKLPIDVERVEDCISRILSRIRGVGEREIPSAMIGEFVMDELRNLDQVAYVRFAAVYRRFADIREFGDEIERLKCRDAAEKKD